MKRNIFQEEDFNIFSRESVKAVIEGLQKYPDDAWVEVDYGEYHFSVSVCWNREETDEEYESRLAFEEHSKQVERQRKKEAKLAREAMEKKELERLMKKYKNG